MNLQYGISPECALSSFGFDMVSFHMMDTSVMQEDKLNKS